MEFAIPGYLLVFATLAVYSFYVVRRGRHLAEQVPEDQQRFLGDRS